MMVVRLTFFLSVYLSSALRLPRLPSVAVLPRGARLPRPVFAPVVALPRVAPLRAVDVGTRVAGLAVAGFELVEDVGSIGHHHGLGLLCASRLARDVSGGIESVEGLKTGGGGGRRKRVLNFITNKATTRFVMVLALGAAVAEVVGDLAPGGHHGMVLLAANELAETLEGAKVGFARVFEGALLKLALPAAAACFALLEVVKDASKIGAHHGVFALALAEFVKVAGRVAGNLAERGEAQGAGAPEAAPPAKWAWSGPVFPPADA